ncbi:MAG: PKD domain-containing protein, partial [Euryarchaeota archaeon]|nr:PKD domain-containing protein [Euryarchaeota archaeon]
TGSNTWDNGYSSGGNSWSDHVGVDEYHGINQDISGSDGFGDTHYSISGGSNQDHYPLYTGNKKPTATIHTIDPTTASYGATIFFSGGGIDQDGSIVQYSWISNRDGQLYLGSDSSFSTSSLSSGIHEISFTVKDNVGDWSNPATAIVTIIAPQNQKPVAHIVSINPTQTSFGSLVYFYGYGNDEGTIIAYKWTSSIDGVFGTQQSFNRSNLSVGNHLISFQVMDSQGLWSDEDARSLVVVSTSSALNLPPVAIAGGPYSAVVNISLSFDASQSHDQDPQGSIVSYVWNFGDDTTANGVQVEHIYAASGNYTVTLQVTDNNGTKTTATTQASVYKPGELPINGGSNGDGSTETPDNGISFDIPWMIVVPVAGVLIFVGIIIGFFSWMKRS